MLRWSTMGDVLSSQNRKSRPLNCVGLVCKKRKRHDLGAPSGLILEIVRASSLERGVSCLHSRRACKIPGGATSVARLRGWLAPMLRGSPVRLHFRAPFNVGSWIWPQSLNPFGATVNHFLHDTAVCKFGDREQAEALRAEMFHRLLVSRALTHIRGCRQ